MKRKLLWEMLVLVALIVLVGQIGFHTRVASAQSGGYDLTWNTIDGGGGTSTSAPVGERRISNCTVRRFGVGADAGDLCAINWSRCAYHTRSRV